MSVPSFFDQLSRNRYTDNLSVADNLSGRCESYLALLSSILLHVESDHEQTELLDELLDDV